MPKKPLILTLSLLTLVGLLVASYLLVKSGKSGIRVPSEVEKFTSLQDFKTYLSEGQLKGTELFGGVSGLGMGAPAVGETFTPLLKETDREAAPERVSETTVQVVGIDEPDIVKTDGLSIYFSSEGYSYREPLIMEESIGSPLPYKIGETKVVKGFPPADLATDSTIDKTGNLLLTDNVLVIFSENLVLGYDVSNPKSPTKKWEFELETKNQIVSARLYKDKIYLVTQTMINRDRPCPIPLGKAGSTIVIDCTEIYHPGGIVPVDSTFTVFTLNPKDGSVGNKVSFVGSTGSSVVYMSKNATYITYSYFGSLVDFFYNFYSGSGRDLLPAGLIDKIDKLRDYDISEQSKFTELSYLLQNYQATLSDDERLRIENETSNRLEDYTREHARELEKTGIIKINIDGTTVAASGEVPGRPLNQFSLDEYNDNLRIAITVSSNWVASAQSVNDVYVLDKNLNVVGKVTDLGISERIYSVRFIEDKGYVVTFKDIDPFYVLDLGNPASPKLAGELKIPGYSSYLQPITKDKILGVGKEENQVKVSLFDVSSPNAPYEASKYTLDEYWSDVLNTHHAFLLDEAHQVFFLPGGKGGYIFSYKGDALALTRAISDTGTKRAIYINNYIYIISESKITVLNEADWQEVNSLSF